MTAEPRKPIDWEKIEAEFRAGQLSIREIARQYACSEGAIRRRVLQEGWTRPLADQVREAVREKLVRADNTHAATHSQRATDAQIIDGASSRGFEVVISQRRDIAQLDALASIIATRLSELLSGIKPDGLCLGDKESVGDLLEKLSRIKARLIPLQRQAHNLDAESDPSAASGGRGRLIEGQSIEETARVYREIMDRNKPV